MSDSESALEPSVEDVLASIRRILDEDQPLNRAAGSAGQAGHDDELLLDTSMLIEASPHPKQADARIPAGQAPAPDGSPLTALLAPEPQAAATRSIRDMLHTLAADRTAQVQPGATIEDLVRLELRPLLEAWLNTHLPPLVERIVRAEIERVVGHAGLGCP
jgi:cell pole-organizing protein PopZ